MDAHSRFVQAAGLRWHLQLFGPPSGDADEILLLHGTGACAQSWRDIAPALAARRRVIVPDLPGHARSSRPASPGLSLPGMAASLGALLQALNARPRVIVGHSAGAAIAARMVLDGHAHPEAIISLNGAWLPPSGQGLWFYEPLARLLVMNPLVPYLFSMHARQRGTLQRLLASTGSRLDEAGLAMYRGLVADPAHVSAVLAMMACWDLRPLLADLPRLHVALHLVVAEGDRTVPPRTSQHAQQQVSGATMHRLPGLGHLAHEEAPQAVLQLLQALLPGPRSGPGDARDPPS